MKLPEDGHMSGRNMYQAYPVYNILSQHSSAFDGFGIISKHKDVFPAISTWFWRSTARVKQPITRTHLSLLDTCDRDPHPVVSNNASSQLQPNATNHWPPFCFVPQMLQHADDAVRPTTLRDAQSPCNVTNQLTTQMMTSVVLWGSYTHICSCLL